MAFAPAELRRTRTQAFNQLAGRVGALGIGRIDLGVVAHTKFHRVELEFLGHLVHGDFQRHQAGRFARRAHRIAFGQVKGRQAHAHQAIFARVQQFARLRGALDLATGQVAGPAFVAHGGDLAVGGGANADALDGRRAVRGIVEHHWPRQRHFYRPARQARTQCCKHCVGADEQFAAESAADVGRYQPHLVLGHPEGGGQVGDGPVDHLVGSPQRQLIALP